MGVARSDNRATDPRATDPRAMDRRNPDSRNPDSRAEVKRVLLVALAVNVAMSLLKLVVGLMSGSLAVLADAMHSATDGLSSLLGLLTNGLSDPQPDRDHPYGHDKYEAIGALAIAGFILFAAFEILRTAIERIATGLKPLRMDGQDLLVLLLALGFNLLLAGYERSEGRRLKSQLLLADARHTTSDIWTTVMVLLGLAGVLLLKQNWFDVAVPLCLLLVRACWQVLRDNLPWLVDQIAIAPEAIHEVAMAVPGVLNVHDIASRGVLGQRVFIELHMVVDADDLPTAHRITELVEEHLQARFGEVRCTIHLEPREYAIPTSGTHG
jgi:cation diffusion facilitator family transporter